MSDTDKVLALVLFFFVAALLAFSTGYSVAVGKYRGELANYQEQRGMDQARISQLEEANYLLADRQSTAISIIERTAGTLAEASGRIDTIEGYTDAILESVDSLSAAYRLLVKMDTGMEGR